jgi:hypothetical protein
MPKRSIRSEFEILGELRRLPELFELLSAISGGELHLQQELRREFPDDLVRAALLLADLRRRAHAKFSRADAMWFNRKGLEQATSEPIALHKSRRFQGRVWDYCSGIGGDALALAGAGDVIAVDRNLAACRCTAWNAEVYGVADRVQPVCMDVTLLTDRTGLVHVDPDQRDARGARSRRLEDCVPGLPFLRTLVDEFAGGAIKLSPASNFAGKFAAVEYELVSSGGQCKEAIVWFGKLHSGVPWRATVLPEGATLAGDPMDFHAELQPLGGYLFDPDPAVVRAGMVDMLGEREGLSRLDEEEEYLTADAPVQTPFAQVLKVIADLPNNERAIRRYFRQQDFGQVEIKCRRVSVPIEALRRKLTLAGSEPAVLIFARIEGSARAVVCRRLA